MGSNMPKQITFSPGDYVTVYLDKNEQPIFPPVEKSLVVAVRPRSLDVQTPNDEVWKVFRKQLEKPKEGFLRPEEAFLKNLANEMQYSTKEYGDGSISYFSKKWLKEQLVLIKKNYLVKDVYITKKGNLLVETHSLPIYDWDGEQLSPKIGRMVIKLNPQYNGSRGIAIKNLDWHRSIYEHPHVSNTGFGQDAGVCLGGAREYAKKAWTRGDIFNIIEILLAMITQFNMGNDEYPDWLNRRTRRKGASKGFMEKKARIRWN